MADQQKKRKIVGQQETYLTNDPNDFLVGPAHWIYDDDAPPTTPKTGQTVQSPDGPVPVYKMRPKFKPHP